MKKYVVTENGAQTAIEATNRECALAAYFQCEKPVKSMYVKNTWSNRRYSKNTKEGYRTATITKA